MTTLNIEIFAGVDTCATVPGEFCQFMGSIKFGLTPICLLFPPLYNGKYDGAYTVLQDKDGWVQRCDACKQAEFRGSATIVRKPTGTGAAPAHNLTDDEVMLIYDEAIRHGGSADSIIARTVRDVLAHWYANNPS